MSALIVPDVPNVSTFTLSCEIIFIELSSFIVSSLSVCKHLTIPVLPSNLINRIPFL